MNNQELELKVKEILANKNFFDMIETMIAFEKEYKGTDFYKKTKMSLMEVVKNAKIWYALQLEDLVNKIQTAIDGLDLAKLHSLLDDMGKVFDKENEEIMSAITQLGAIIK